MLLLPMVRLCKLLVTTMVSTKVWKCLIILIHTSLVKKQQGCGNDAHADEMVGQELPVIIHNAFGGVILHEACGHS